MKPLLPRRLAALCVMLVSLLGFEAFAGPPAGYYDAVDTSQASPLRDTLHEVIDDHARFPYTSTATDTWDILEAADEDPGNSNNILDVYRNASFAKAGGGNSLYNREHTWPSSYGFPNDNSQNYPFTDCHQLFLSDDGYNSSRSNKPFRQCDANCTEKPTDANNGSGGGSGSYPGNSNWTSGALTAGTWEVWGGRRGDIARALFYLDVRYEGDTHGTTGASEPDLILTDDESLIAASNTGGNEPTAYMGMLSVLIQWHLDDPVDAVEMARNDAVYSNQGNRNPFIDHPEWVGCVFLGQCGGCTTDPDCDDGTFCNGAETCNAGTCASGADPCPGQSCDEPTDTCFDPVCDNNGTCDSGEDCNNCAGDCISGGGATCGNGVCEAGDGEDCVSCAADCNGKQSGKQSNRYCCGDGDGQNPVSCADGRCGVCTDTPAAPYCCGDGTCDGAEDGFVCSVDCGLPPFCGDGTCDPGESACDCAGDCGAPPTAELVCGDGLDDDCDGDVDCDDIDCAGDPVCPVCDGDGVCDPGEDCLSCASDCKGKQGGKPANRYCCGNGVVESAESSALCDGNF